MIIVTFSEIIALKCSGVRGWTEAELGLFFFLFCTNFANYGRFVCDLGGWSTDLAVYFFKCLESGK